MASYTPNYNLKKPAGTDVVDIADLNGNMDIIDTQLNSLNSKLSTLGNIDDLQGNITASGSITVNLSPYRYIMIALYGALHYRISAIYPVTFFTGSYRCGWDNCVEGNNRCYFLKQSYDITTHVLTYAVQMPSSGLYENHSFYLYGIK